MKKLIVWLSLVCVANLVSAQWNLPPAGTVILPSTPEFPFTWDNFDNFNPSNSISTSTPVVVPDNSSSNSSSSTTSNRYKRKKKRCQHCNGSGTVIDYCTGFGNTKWCSKCGKEVSDSHYHTTCPSCKGAGEW